MKHFTAVIERDTDTGLYVGWVPGFPGAHSQGNTLEELRANLQEVVAARRWRPATRQSVRRHSHCRSGVVVATVPFHQGRDISPTLLRQIAKDIGVSIDNLLSREPHE
jgi:hypothetical protein